MSPLKRGEIGYHIVCHDCDALESVVGWRSEELGDRLAEAERHRSTGHNVSVAEVRG